VSPKVVLVGLPGAGKSSTGRRLAKILAVPFADSDALIEAREGHSIAELFATRGEPECRRIEAEVVAAAMHDFAGVLSLGGGALTHAGTRAVLADGAVPVVYLRATLDTLAVRVGDGESRPLLAGDPRGRLAELAAARLPVYESVATFAVDTDGKAPGPVAATIAARLHDLEVARLD
jgi:shikimate kinase